MACVSYTPLQARPVGVQYSFGGPCYCCGGQKNKNISFRTFIVEAGGCQVVCAPTLAIRTSGSQILHHLPYFLATPPPPCESNMKILKEGGNNTYCCFDTWGKITKGKIGHGSKGCRNNTDFCSDKGVRKRVRYDTLVCFGLQLAAPVGRSPLTYCPSLGPFPPIGGGAHQPLTTLCPFSPSVAYLSLSTTLSFPLVGCANGAPRLSLFHCSVLGPHRGGQLPSPLARCVQMRTQYQRWGTRSHLRLLGPRMPSSSCGVTSRMGARNNLLSVLSRTQSSSWRAHHIPPAPRPVSVVCVLCRDSHAWHGCHPLWCVVDGVR